MSPGASLHLGTLPLLPASDLAIAALGVGGFVIYIVWLTLLLRRVRPAVARRLGDILGVSIGESYRGQWSVKPGASLRLGCIVGLADIAVLLLGTLGPLILLSLVALLAVGP